MMKTTIISVLFFVAIPHLQASGISTTGVPCSEKGAESNVQGLNVVFEEYVEAFFKEAETVTSDYDIRISDSLKRITDLLETMRQKGIHVDTEKMIKLLKLSKNLLRRPDRSDEQDQCLEQQLNDVMICISEKKEIFNVEDLPVIYDKICSVLISCASHMELEEIEKSGSEPVEE
ncbi:MAG: hypothetical protein K2L24_01665 [Opitutales bacterium]|nr:hypothetical protein [Opitutales bacterium]